MLRTIALATIALALGLSTSTVAQDLDAEEEKVAATELDKSRYGGWPRLLVFSDATLTHTDPNAAMWIQPDMRALTARTVIVHVGPEADKSPAKELVEQYKAAEWPVVVICDWQGQELARFPGRIDPAAFKAALVRHAIKAPVLSPEELGYQLAHLAKAKKELAKGRVPEAIDHFKWLLARRLKFGAAAEAQQAMAELEAAAKEAVIATYAITDEALWKKECTKLQDRYRGIALKPAIEDVKAARAEREARCAAGKKAAEDALAAGDLVAARAALATLAKEQPHPAAEWAAGKLAELDGPPR